MSAEPLKPDFGECKDVAFARNLVRQMKEGFGRHNSNRTFHPAGSDETFVSFCRLESDRLSERLFQTAQENQDVRVVGRFGDHYIRESARGCEIGDAFPFCDALPGNGRYLKVPKHREIDIAAWQPDQPIQFDAVTCMLFELVACEMTPDNGRTWQRQYFWKRIE